MIYLESSDIAGLIDHTLLRADATRDQILKLCREAIKYRFAAVCVNPCYVPVCAKELKDSEVQICTVIGFPLGASATSVKIFEAEEAIRNGADEIDMVMNVGMLKSGNEDYFEKDISAVVKSAHKSGAIVKVIVETALLTNKEKVKACLIAKRAGADFVKTCTGFTKSGAKPADVRLLRKTLGVSMGVKASGGIKSHEDAILMIKSGANRIGSSAGIRLIGKTVKKSGRKKPTTE